ncbi:hypothetical protein J6590_053733 [Homalodisca vitripennis]|nr:hypothetical protein J6590_053733 [Homalodisca vitripennis]
MLPGVVGLPPAVTCVMSDYVGVRAQPISHSVSMRSRALGSKSYGTKDRVQITKIRLEDGRIEQNPQAIANLFNDYFVSVAQQLITSPPGPRPDTLRYCQHQPRSLFLNPVTHKEISSIIKSL